MIELDGLGDGGDCTRSLDNSKPCDERGVANGGDCEDEQSVESTVSCRTGFLRLNDENIPPLHLRIRPPRTVRSPSSVSSISASLGLEGFKACGLVGGDSKERRVVL